MTETPGALRARGSDARARGDLALARSAEAAALQASLRHPRMAAAARHHAAGNLAAAEPLLREHLRHDPDDAAALALLADIAAQAGIFVEAERLFRSALAQAPDLTEVQLKLAGVLFQQNRAEEAIALLDLVLTREPDNIAVAGHRLFILGQIGRYDRSLTDHGALLARHPADPGLLTSYANLLKTVGRRDDSIAAFRRALAVQPALGDAWWGLANLKTGALDAGDIDRMRAQLARRDLAAPARVQIDFALGKALEDAGDPADAFRHYAAGNDLQHRLLPHDAAALSDEVDRSIRLYTPGFFAARDGCGNPAPDPIFILGMPRAGSTLVEQILASHSHVEGTSELPDIPLLIQRLLAARWRDRGARHPEIVADVPPQELAALGRQYLDAAALHRRLALPRFIDKLPNNWLHVGLILSILPNARIIDARREPLSCCWSNFKQYFARGQAFSYDLADLGRYYRDYERMMAHWDAVLPGRVHRVQHETLVADPEPVIRSLLDYCGLPFEPACLTPERNARPVRTASAEQVRRPISGDALDAWRPYEPWLGELKAALGI